MFRFIRHNTRRLQLYFLMLQHISASNGNESFVTLLLKFGADPNAKGTLQSYNDLMQLDNTFQK